MDATSRRAEPAGVATTGERLRLLALAALTAALLGLCALLAAPLVPALTWGVALAILAWPMHRRLARRLDRPGLAAALSTAAVVAAVLGPGTLIGVRLAREATALAQRLDAPAGGDTRPAADAPGPGRLSGRLERLVAAARAEAGRWLRSSTREAAALARGSAAAVVQALVAVFVLYYLLRDRAAALDALRRLLPLARDEADLLVTRAADSVHANLYAAVVTGLVIAASGGLLFWALGLPAPLLWATVMFLLSVLPVVGPVAVWAPAAAYLAASGRWLAAAALVGWGVATAVLVTNLLYARLLGDRLRMHDVPTLISFLGGLAAFGISGMVLGPAILAVTAAMLEIWRRRLAGGGGSGRVAVLDGAGGPVSPEADAR
ncbi:AI-2E family transporter [Tautonia plasticadhaerens]|uniref:Putative inner membrane protein n=1 Tax=Tautonia plasticadhaerens TaxID=2527974 RepID=A0A518HEZ8_9BACT|nr:AI-2E family transporter [Tautonia plasticadhaerens]QDV39425.1 putative inner membrane protein [Tautonia plasticadhaerens]